MIPVESEAKSRRFKPGPAVWVGAGVILGLGIALAFSLYPKPGVDAKAASSGPAFTYREPEPKAVPSPSEPVQAPAHSKPSGISPPIPEPSKGEKPLATASPAPPASPPAMGGQLPSGAIGSPLSGGSVAPLTPIVIEGGGRTPGPTENFVEYAVIVPETEFESTLNDVRSLARANQGQISFEFVHDPDRPEMGAEVVFSAAPAGAAKAREAVLKLAVAQELDRWEGPFSERRHRMSRFLREAIDKLQSKLRQLLVKYLEDAPEVVRTKESLGRYEQALKGFRGAPAGKEAVRVFVGKTAPP